MPQVAISFILKWGCHSTAAFFTRWFFKRHRKLLYSVIFLLKILLTKFWYSLLKKQHKNEIIINITIENHVIVAYATHKPASAFEWHLCCLGGVNYLTVFQSLSMHTQLVTNPYITIFVPLKFFNNSFCTPHAVLEPALFC